MPKRYIILAGEDYFLVPIKARLNPHTPGRAAYLAGMPNFFGGADSNDGTAFATLQREVDEESAMTCVLFGYTNIAVYQGNYYAGGRLVQCDFYYSRMWTKYRPWPDQGVWAAMAADFREMCFVAKVERRHFAGIPAGGGNAALYFNAIMAAARETAPQWARDQFQYAPDNAFMQSQTAQALTLFVTQWLNGTLPGDIDFGDEQVKARRRPVQATRSAATPPRHFFSR